MKSMTAYGYAEYQTEAYLLTMELKSYNNRYLDISYYAPPVLGAYEAEITELIKKYAQRGHIDLSVKIKNLKSNAKVQLDESLASSYLDAIQTVQKLAQEKGVVLSLSMSDVISQDGVLNSVKSDEIEAYREGLDHCCAIVLQQFAAAKQREGEATCRDLTAMIDSLEASLDDIKTNVSKLDEMVKTNLVNRIHEMLGDQNYDENRILTEVAVMLNRFTINEETVRLTTHIAEFRKLLASSEAVGKRMDFLSQEMNREINTIGSKSQMVEVNLQVVNMKDCLENIREQVRNIE
jgi:uncharacterized protein (TIGR00255 family)